MNRCHICGKSTATSQGLAGHRWLKHGGKTRQEAVMVQGAAAQQAQQAQPAQAQGPGSSAMIQVPASYLAQLQQQAQLAQPQQGQRPGGADGPGGTEDSTLKTIRVDPVVEAYFEYCKERGGTDDLSIFITECMLDFFRQQGCRWWSFTPV